MKRWNTNRKSRLPDDWVHLRLVVLRRDKFRCTAHGPRCKGVATDVDHIVRGDNHSLDNLQALCSACHAQKTSQEGLKARREKAARRFRPVERHPGQR